MSKIHLKIITPQEIKVDENADMVILRCITGDMGILPGHSACTAVLDYGVLRIRSEDSERKIAVFGGLAELQNDVLTILTSAAEWPEDIDRARAEADLRHAEQRLRERKDDLELQSAQILLRRSLVRIEVSSLRFVGRSNH